MSSKPDLTKMDSMRLDFLRIGSIPRSERKVTVFDGIFRDLGENSFCLNELNFREHTCFVSMNLFYLRIWSLKNLSQPFPYRRLYQKPLMAFSQLCYPYVSK